VRAQSDWLFFNKEKIMFLSNHNATHPQNQKEYEEEYEYSAIVEVQTDKPIVLNIIGKGILP
jgi:hypothetical protein